MCVLMQWYVLPVSIVYIVCACCTCRVCANGSHVCNYTYPHTQTTHIHTHGHMHTPHTYTHTHHTHTHTHTHTTYSILQESVYFSGCAANISLSALSIKDPECHGFLYKQGGSLGLWKRRYCVLKSHQLFYYGKMSHTTAYEVLNLSGYEVERGKEKEKKFYFHATPPSKESKVCKFYTESEVERERFVCVVCVCVYMCVCVCTCMCVCVLVCVRM